MLQTTRRHGASVALLCALALCPMAALPACGGGGGGGVPGTPGTNTAPTATLLLPVFGTAGILGDTVRFAFLSGDDGSAPVRIVADRDGDLVNTTLDQALLWTGPHGNGARQDVDALLDAGQGLTVGPWTVFLEIDDGVNTAVTILLPGRLVVYPGVAGVLGGRSNRYGEALGHIVFSRGEAEDNAGPLNADGDTGDGVAVLLNASTGALVQTVPSPSMDVTPVAGGRAVPVQDSGGTLAWLTLEADENLNLNGGNVQAALAGFAPAAGPDADLLDAMISWVDPSLSLAPKTNTYGGVTPPIVAGIGNLVVADYAEAGEGLGGTDLNGDGDTADHWFGYLDPAAPGPPYEFNQLVMWRAPQPAAPAFSPAFRSDTISIVAWPMDEAQAAPGTDINGDGDTLDVLLGVGDAAAPGGFRGGQGNFRGPVGLPTPVDPAGAFDVSGIGFVTYFVDEAAMNVPAPAGTDVNADGFLGFVPAWFDVNLGAETIPAGVAGPVNTAAGTPTMRFGSGRICFYTAAEGGRPDPGPGTNGDGDLGADGALLYWMDVTSVPAATQPLAVAFGGGLTLTGLALDMGGSLMPMGPGWMALVVNEAANGNQDINGNGMVDMAWLLIEANANPLPLVHNPGLSPSAAGTFPIEGVFADDPANGDSGVVLRLTEAANGDLDNDGTGGETFLAYVSTQAPTQHVLLPAGGDHVAVANGRVAITAQEAYTGQDHDGNGLATDTALVMCDFAGNLVDRGRLCSPLSVPVSGSGQAFAYLRSEPIEGRDLNGDGDQADLVLGVWVP